MPAAQTLGDVAFRRVAFFPGDRVIIRTTGPVTRDDCRKLQGMAQRAAGCPLRIAVVDCVHAHVSSPRLGTIAGPEHTRGTPGLPGVASVSVGQIGLQPGDRLDVVYDHPLLVQEKQELQAMWRAWAGDGVEVVLADKSEYTGIGQ